MPKGIYNHHQTKTPIYTEERNRKIGKANWKGELVGYAGLHMWVRRRIIKPLKCFNCKQVKPLDLANKSHEYKRDLDDWLYLCRSCYLYYDYTKERRNNLSNSLKKITSITRFKKGDIPWNKTK